MSSMLCRSVVGRATRSLWRGAWTDNEVTDEFRWLELNEASLGVGHMAPAVVGVRRAGAAVYSSADCP